MSKHLSAFSESSGRPFDSSGPAIPVVAVEFPSGRTELPAVGARPILVLGHRGPAVEELQDRIDELGDWLAVDGVFGPQTRAAVIRLQQANGMKPDGVVGPLTWDVLDAVPVQIQELSIDEAAALDLERSTLDGVGELSRSTRRS